MYMYMYIYTVHTSCTYMCTVAKHVHVYNNLYICTKLCQFNPRPTCTTTVILLGVCVCVCLMPKEGTNAFGAT